MNETVDPFKPSKAEFEEVMEIVKAKLALTQGPNDEVTLQAGNLVVFMAGSMRVKDSAEADKRRLDYVFSDQTDLLIVDHGDPNAAREPKLILSRAELDRIIKERS